MIAQGRAVQLAAPLSLTLIWQRHMGNKSKQQRLHNIRVQGQGSEEMHPAHAENNYPNTFSWPFGTLTGGTGQPHGVCSSPCGRFLPQPAKSLFLAAWKTEILGLQYKAASQETAEQALPTRKNRWALRELSSGHAAVGKRLQRHGQQHSWEVKDKIPAHLGHQKLPKAIKQGAAAGHVPEMLSSVTDATPRRPQRREHSSDL